MQIKTSVVDAVSYFWDDEYSILFWLIRWDHKSYGSVKIKIGFFCIEGVCNGNDDN